MRFKKQLIFLLLASFLAMGTVHVTEAQSRQVRKKERLSEKAKRDQKQNFKKARKKELDRRFKIQTEKTQKRMVNSRKEAKKFNDSFSHRKKGLFNRKRKRK